MILDTFLSNQVKFVRLTDLDVLRCHREIKIMNTFFSTSCLCSTIWLVDLQVTDQDLLSFLVMHSIAGIRIILQEGNESLFYKLLSYNVEELLKCEIVSFNFLCSV